MDRNDNRFRKDLEGGGDEFARLLAEQGDAGFVPLNQGDRVTGRIVAIGAEAVLVDVGQRSEASVPLTAFRDEERAHLAPGQEAAFYVVKTAGGIELGRAASAPEGLGIDALTAAKESGLPVEAKITGENKGGFTVALGGVRGFVPFSQMELGRALPAAEYIGRTFQFRVTEVRGKEAVLSRAALLREEQDRARAEVMARLNVGDVVEATVARPEYFGLFVEVGPGVQALIPMSELAWSRRDPKEFPPGTPMSVKIIEIKQEKGRPRITASLKQLQQDPWTLFVARVKEGDVLRGTVTRLAPFGAFVQVEAGIEGLLHNSRIGSEGKLRPGQEIEVVVAGVEAGARRIALATQRPEVPVDQETKAKYEGGGNERLGSLGDALRKALDAKKTP